MTRVRIRRDDVAWQEVDDDLIILDERNSVYMRLVGTATLLWPLLVDGASEDELSSALVNAYRIGSQQAEADVGAFLTSLRTQDLLESAL